MTPGAFIARVISADMLSKVELDRSRAVNPSAAVDGWTLDGWRRLSCPSVTLQAISKKAPCTRPVGADMA